MSTMSLVWTREKPAVDGWYWVKSSPKKWNEVLGELVPEGEYKTEMVKVMRGHIVRGCPWSVEGTEFFAGPIPEPTDAQNGGAK